MLTGKSIFDSPEIDEMVEKTEIGSYYIPTDFSKEVISFLNSMLQVEFSDRLDCEKLSKHPFLVNDIKNFHPIEIEKISKYVDSKGLKLNINDNKIIREVLSEEDESK